MTPEFSAALWNRNPDALLAIASDGAVMHWRPAAETVFSAGAREAQGRSIFDLIVRSGLEAEQDGGSRRMWRSIHTPCSTMPAM